MDTSGYRQRIAIVGTGYVGMACTIGFAEFGHEVVGFDILVERVRSLQAGITPYNEAGMRESLAAHLKQGNIRFVESLAEAVRGAQFVIVAVGTPSRLDGSADLSAIDAVVGALCQIDLHGTTVVMRSTVPPGTTEVVAARLRGNAEVIYAPEFLREGSAVADFLNPDRIVIGAGPIERAEAYARLFEHLNRPALITSLRNAELAKGMSNAFLAMKISFANEVANLCDDLDADALEVLDAIGHDKRIGRQFLAPGIGFGGPCFEKDVKSLLHLAGKSGASSELLSAVMRVNTAQPRRIVDTLERELESLSGKRIGVWGLAFKAGTDDVRDSLAVRVVFDLAERGASVIAFDPAVKHIPFDLPCHRVDDALQAADCDALLVLTEWPEFREIDPWMIAHRITSRLVVDGRNVLDKDKVAAAGLTYRGVGRRADALDPLDLAEAG